MEKTYAIIGSRTFRDYQFMKKVLQWYQIAKIISGGAKGADSLAKLYAAEHNIPIAEFLPDWKQFGKSAGFRRNAQIINHCDAVIAFWDGQSKGTQHSVSIAEQTNKPVYIYWENNFDIERLGVS
jgi:predicted Rossmann fold nucleotide-binding protein DprA/Smf involved in DNA uptake